MRPPAEDIRMQAWLAAFVLLLLGMWALYGFGVACLVGAAGFAFGALCMLIDEKRSKREAEDGELHE